MLSWKQRRRPFAITLVLGMATMFAADHLYAQGGPADFLGRLDANGNGMIDPGEVDGRFGFFIQRMAQSNPRIDLSKPIPLKTLADEFARMRDQRSQGGGGPPFGGGPGGPGGPGFGGPGFGGGPGGPQPGRSRGGPDPGSQPGRRDRSSNEPNPYESRVTSVEPLVPGFGIEDVLTPPPGFGSEAQLFTVEVTERDKQEAARSFRYYDRNGDGKVDSDEMKRSRYGADLPLYDRNRDGVITMNEMEYRYARRRTESSAGGNTAAARGSNPSSRGDGGRSNSRQDVQAESSFSKEERWGDRLSYRSAPPLERLPDGLPDWFTRDDANGDGQIAMSEFASSWTESVMADFSQFDLNRDGFVTPAECLKSAEAGTERGDAVATSSSSSSAGSSNAPQAPSVSATSSAGAAPPADIDPRYFTYYQGLVNKYDTNGDGQLTKDEWVNMSKDPSQADANGDGRISVEEFSRWSMK